MKYYYYSDGYSKTLHLYDVISPKIIRKSVAYFKIKYYLSIEVNNKISIDDYSDGINIDEMKKGSKLDKESTKMKTPKDFEFVIRKMFELVKSY